MSQLSTFYPNLITAADIGVGTASNVSFASISALPAANTAALTSTGYSLTGTNAQSLVDLSGTWNTTGTPSAFKLNVTDTASNASSLLMQLQTGGINRFTVSKAGAIVTPSSISVNNITVAGGSNSANGISTGTSYFSLQTNSGGFVIFGRSFLGMNAGGSADTFTLGSASSNCTTLFMSATGSVSFGGTLLLGEAANILGQYNGTNAQESRLYGTFTSTTNYQRMTIKSVKQTLSALSGASATTTGTFIPDGAVVVGVTTRVATALTGATGYTIGDGADADRWGDITGTAIGTTSDNANWTAGTIECFTAGGNVTLTAKTSNFTAGAIEICVFYLAGQAD